MTEAQAAWAYHNGTKHSPESVRRSRHVLDWEIMPRPFKVYVDLEPLPLPRDLSASTMPALAALTGAGSGAAIDRERLARLLHFSAGIVRRRAYPGGEIYYRAAACTGALYHIDFYLVSGPLADLEAGVYHFGPHDFALRCLRRGDFRGALIEATAGNAAIAAAPVVLVAASTFWRNAWKYQARAYRHCWWDAGTMLANLLAVSAAAEVRAHVALGFADAEVDRLLDLDPMREASLALVALGETGASAPSPPPSAPLGLRTLPLSAREVDYPQIRAMHAASSLTPDEVAAWRAGIPTATAQGDRGRAVPGPPSTESIESVILRRGSTRNFADRSIAAAQLDAILAAASADVDCDYAAPGERLAEIYVIANAVDGLEAGTHVNAPASGGRPALQLLRSGDFRREAGFLDLGQELAQDAAVNLYWLADLDPILSRLGNRGYRAAQLDAAIGGGRAYLASYAQRLGATGLTFFDDEVTAFFAPHAAGKSVMFLVAAGKGGPAS